MDVHPFPRSFCAGVTAPATAVCRRRPSQRTGRRTTPAAPRGRAEAALPRPSMIALAGPHLAAEDPVSVAAVGEDDRQQEGRAPVRGRDLPDGDQSPRARSVAEPLRTASRASPWADPDAEALYSSWIGLFCRSMHESIRRPLRGDAPGINSSRPPSQSRYQLPSGRGFIQRKLYQSQRSAADTGAVQLILVRPVSSRCGGRTAIRRAFPFSCRISAGSPPT